MLLLKANMAKQQALQVQLSKIEPELKRYADKLAFTMVGLKGAYCRIIYYSKT
jgi:hypothetical protein